MKKNIIKKMISITCCVIGLIISIIGLIVGFKSIGGEGFEQLGIIFIIPSIIVLISIILDFLITIDVIKEGLIYSIIITIIKIRNIFRFIPSTIYEYKYEKNFGTSNFRFYIFLMLFIIIITIPSVLNIIKLKSKK